MAMAIPSKATTPMDENVMVRSRSFMSKSLFWKFPETEIPSLY